MKRLLFAPVTWNIAETTRMIEVARACGDQFECTSWATVASLSI